MELKRAYKYQEDHLRQSFTRTFMELKHNIIIGKFISRTSFTRTFMELKRTQND